jgi:hypothetical protein
MQNNLVLNPENQYTKKSGKNKEEKGEGRMEEGEGRREEGQLCCHPERSEGSRVFATRRNE